MSWQRPARADMRSAFIALTGGAPESTGVSAGDDRRPTRRGFTIGQYLICLHGIAWREALRFVHQRERFISALVRPLVWLFIFAAGFRQILGVSIIPPYETYVLYEVYVTPGLMAMIQLFNGMQSSLSMVYDREMGNMRMLLVSPFPRWFLLTGKLLASTVVSILQVYAYLVVAWLWGVEAPVWGYVAVLPALALTGMMLGALGMLLSSAIRQLENFAGVMNFVIFPMFFASSALYPLWLVQQSSPVVYAICRLNPFTYAVELIRFALYAEIDWMSLAVVVAMTIVFTTGAIIAYDPARGLIARRGGGGMKCRAVAAFAGLALAALFAGASANAAPPGPRDPDWPCQQIKVPRLSLAAVWSGPPLDRQQTDWRQDQQVADLVHDVAQRRVPVEQAQDKSAHSHNRPRSSGSRSCWNCLPACSACWTTNAAPSLSGWTGSACARRNSPPQFARTTKSCGRCRRIPRPMRARSTGWCSRSRGTRRSSGTGSQALSYACDVPGKIEQRLFALARIIQQELQ